MGVSIAGSLALVGFALASGDREDVGPFVIAIMAIIVNASGPGAICRHLDQLRA